MQDLTPQLRTRLSRVERAVGWFVTLATLVLLAGFAYYIHHTAARKGWFLTKIDYQTSIQNAAGLKRGDPVYMMGFQVGEITRVEANAPWEYFNVTVYFRVHEPYFGYIWMDSRVKVTAADLLGNRYLEITKGREGKPTVRMEKNEIIDRLDYFERVDPEFQRIFAAIKEREPGYTDHAARIDATNELYEVMAPQLDAFYGSLQNTAPYWIDPQESPAVTDRLEQVMEIVESALPNILNLTNQLTAVLAGASEAGEQLNSLLAEARPIVTNLTVITDNLREPKGSFGEWLIPANLSAQLESTLLTTESTLKTADTTLKTADLTLASTDTNLTSLVTNLSRTLDNLADITSNLNAQVEMNTNILSGVSTMIVNADELVQGLKRHWLLRSAFKKDPAEDRERVKQPSRPIAPRLRK